MIIVNACPLCLVDEESVNHLLHRKLTNAHWSSTLKEFNFSWVLPQSLSELFHQCYCPISSTKGKATWRLSFLACIWTIWKERNKRCFEGIDSSQEDLILNMKFCVASWVSHLPDFWGLPLDAIMYNWREDDSP